MRISSFGPETLPALLRHSATHRGTHPAAEEPPEYSISYADLDALSDAVAAWLCRHGVRRGDRVGVLLPKSIDAVAAIYGSMKAGAAYVPVDADGPPSRAAWILQDCQVRVLITEATVFEAVQRELDTFGAPPCPTLILDGTGGGSPLGQALRAGTCVPAAGGTVWGDPTPDDLACVLYTSGSTGQPKGVMLTHRNVMAFVRWCVETFTPRDDDRFSSHAPFHFDLSILDLYVAAWRGATVILIGAARGREPQGLADLIASAGITVWYSTPSVLSLLAQYGKIERHAFPRMRLVLFAGEVFPPRMLRKVQERIPARYANLYGPTETNVCAWHPIPDVVPEDRRDPYPIGAVCPHLRARIVDPEDRPVGAGETGELLIAGANVMQGYWHRPDRTAEAFFVDLDGTRWYRTGDLVREGDNGVLTFLGRRDRMVKRRGYRIELGEIEAALHRHPAVHRAAVVAIPDEESGVRIVAHVAAVGGRSTSTIAMKRYCAEALPRSMVPDAFAFHDELPRTSTDKTDYRQLASA